MDPNPYRAFILKLCHWILILLNFVLVLVRNAKWWGVLGYERDKLRAETKRCLTQRGVS